MGLNVNARAYRNGSHPFSDVRTRPPSEPSLEEHTFVRSFYRSSSFKTLLIDDTSSMEGPVDSMMKSSRVCPLVVVYGTKFISKFT